MSKIPPSLRKPVSRNPFVDFQGEGILPGAQTDQGPLIATQLLRFCLASWTEISRIVKDFYNLLSGLLVGPL